MTGLVALFWALAMYLGISVTGGPDLTVTDSSWSYTDESYQPGGLVEGEMTVRNNTAHTLENGLVRVHCADASTYVLTASYPYALPDIAPGQAARVTFSINAYDRPETCDYSFTAHIETTLSWERERVPEQPH